MRYRGWECIQQLKKVFCTTPVLAMSDIPQSFILETDTCEKRDERTLNTKL